jgi:hypothetical protein
MGSTLGRACHRIHRDAVIFVVWLGGATALTLVGTYYVVDWVSPPITQSMPRNR